MEKEENKRLNLEESFEKLEGMIELLSDRETPREQAFLTYQQGMKLVKECQEQIDLVEKQVLVLDGEGEADAFQ